MTKIKTSEIDHVSSAINYGVNTFIENKDLLYTVEFTGWAFFLSEHAINNKEIKLVFDSGDNRYEAETELQERFDLWAVLQENNIPGYKHGFITKFSPLQMKNGIYKLYLFCYENEMTSGIVDTQLMFIKTYRNFSEYKDIPVSETGVSSDE
jgi:hypothetical protein